MEKEETGFRAGEAAGCAEVTASRKGKEATAAKRESEKNRWGKQNGHAFVTR